MLSSNYHMHGPYVDRLGLNKVLLLIIFKCSELSRFKNWINVQLKTLSNPPKDALSCHRVRMFILGQRFLLFISISCKIDCFIYQLDFYILGKHFYLSENLLCKVLRPTWRKWNGGRSTSKKSRLHPSWSSF